MIAFINQLSSIAKVLNCHFTLRGQPLSVEQVFSETGMLPGIMRRADQLCSFCMGYGLGLSYEVVAGAMLGNRVKFDDKTPNTLRLLCVADVLVEFMYKTPVKNTTPLDELLADG
jgi:intracellular multiplication protein IcmS